MADISAPASSTPRINYAPANDKKRVLVVGAGAAGMSCAAHLSNHPAHFDITLIDAQAYCGGQAFSIPLDKQKHGAEWLNQGVQGGSFIFHHTLTMMGRLGYHADPVRLQVSFGKDETFWSNVYPTQLLERHQREIKRFKTVLKLVRWFELIFALIPIKYIMKIFWFSDEFTNTIVLPMVALFLGTGNYTPNVPSIILERLVTSPTYGMWYPGDEVSVASNLPPMVVFPKLGAFYSDWKESLIKKGVRVRLSTELTQVVRRDKNGVSVKLIQRTREPDLHNADSAWVPGNKQSNADSDAPEVEEHYDELVLCVLADTANRILKPTSGILERKILGSAIFADDITITHSDTAYMKRHYENFYNPSLAVPSLSGHPQTSRLQHAQSSFRPMYYIKTYPSDRRKLEMSFDCTHYQAQFPPSVPFENHVFQTIFLNKHRDEKLWDIAQIDQENVIRRDWWHQLCHSWTHYLLVVPWMWVLQGRKRTRFAAAWTLVNAHEVAVISGIAAAVDLGAEYPKDLQRDRFAWLVFRLYYLLQYGKWYRGMGKGKDEGADADAEGSDWASGVYGSVYRGPGVAKRERTLWREENGIVD